MKQKNTGSLISGKAYQVFRTELRKHLGISEELLAGSGPLGTEPRTKLASTFHTIRGGAGFFGLDKIAEISERLEVLFNQADFDVDGDLATARELFDNLKVHTDQVLNET